jgi:hypothetical protein
VTAVRASTVVRKVTSAVNVVRTVIKKNNILRIGPSTKGAPIRVSIGAQLKYWEKMSPLRQRLQPCTVILKERKARSLTTELVKSFGSTESGYCEIESPVGSSPAATRD